MEIMEARRKVDRVVKVRLRMLKREFKALSMVEWESIDDEYW